ncbi:Multimodular transpeptidase-transglycosylase [hydrothermal vent metagenome]|uniref:Penicillin-binding protein 1A n=1 Tax=hydrothermal vent metagenome TaxID=652676 RepID=A0A3B0S457_9ZZZZ
MFRLLGFLFTAGFIVFVAVAAAAGYVINETTKTLPAYEQLAKYEPKVLTRIHAGDGSLLAEYAEQRRLFVPINTVPEKVIQAFISAEDKNFYKHAGVDWTSVARAVIRRVEYKIKGINRNAGGASTITQQVAKNFLLTNAPTLERKLKEALLAQRIEASFSKGKILELYLNEIYFGLGAYGIAGASLSYFGKSLTQLDIAQMAYLAALPKAPSNYHPYKNTKRAIERRNWVVGRMLANGYISQEEHDAAIKKPLEVTVRPFGAQLFAAETFAEEVRREAVKLYGKEKLYGGGLSIRTTLDPKSQIFARQALTSGLIKYDRERGWRGAQTTVDITADWGAVLNKTKVPSDITPWQLAAVLEVTDEGASVGLRPKTLANGKLDTKRVTVKIPFELMKWARQALPKNQRGPPVEKPSEVLNPGDVIYVAPSRTKGEWHLVQMPEVEGALVAMNPHTGRVLALVGGFSYGRSQFDRAVQAMRQPGSAIKPFVYATALDNGYSPASVIVDEEISYKLPQGKIWKPRNYSKKYYGPSTLRTGIEQSRNVMTVRLADDMGIGKFKEMTERVGVYKKMPRVLAMALGAGETTLMNMVTAYSMFANGGKRINATLIDRIQDRYGRTVFRHDQRECIGCKAEKWENQAEPEFLDNREQIVNEYTAYQITSMLEGVVQRGTAKELKKLGKPVAGKTGTTNDEKDAWFIGYTPDLVVGVYVGYDKPRPMGKGSTGGGLAAPIVRQYMELALKGKPATPFRVPAGIQLIPINSKSGTRAAYGDENVILEAFKPGEEPPEKTILISGDAIPQSGEAAVIEGGLTTGTGGLY